MAHYLPALGIIVALLCGALKCKRNHPYIYIVVLHLSIALAAELYSLSSASSGTNNLTALRIYTVEEYLLLSLVFARYIRTKLYVKAILVSTLIFIMICVLEACYAAINSYNSGIRALEAALLVVLAIVYLADRTQQKPRKEDFALDLFAFSILVYFGSSFLSFLAINTLIHSLQDEIVQMIWKVHLYLCFIYYSLLGLSFLKYKASIL